MTLDEYDCVHGFPRSPRRLGPVHESPSRTYVLHHRRVTEATSLDLVTVRPERFPDVGVSASGTVMS